MDADLREEQHAFVWSSLESGPEHASVHLQRGFPFHPPPTEPSLPDGITHLWIASIGRADRAMLEAAGRSHPHT